MRNFFIAFIIVITGSAQAKEPLKFDVASVRPNTLNDHIVQIHAGPGDTFSARAYTLKLLIQQAYDLKSFQISGGPSWAGDGGDLYDVMARCPANTSRTQMNQMLQSLLAERFALKEHTGSKEMQGFELTAGGDHPNLKPSTAMEDNPMMSHNEKGALVANGTSMGTLAKILGALLGRPVVDATGLTGLFDVKFFYTERADQLPDPDAKPDALPGISLVSAVKDQLGLKLTSKKVAAEVLVIDSAEKATPN